MDGNPVFHILMQYCGSLYASTEGQSTPSKSAQFTWIGSIISSSTTHPPMPSILHIYSEAHPACSPTQSLPPHVSPASQTPLLSSAKVGSALAPHKPVDWQYPAVVVHPASSWHVKQFSPISTLPLLHKIVDSSHRLFSVS